MVLVDARRPRSDQLHRSSVHRTLDRVQSEVADLRLHYPDLAWSATDLLDPPALPEAELAALGERYPDLDWRLSNVDKLEHRPDDDPAATRAMLHAGAHPKWKSSRAAGGTRPSSARPRQKGERQLAASRGAMSARSTSSLPERTAAPAHFGAPWCRPTSARCGGHRQPHGHSRSSPRLHAESYAAELDQRVVYHASKPLAQPSAEGANQRGFTGWYRPPTSGGWKPGVSGTRRALGANHPPGYRGLSLNQSTPAYTMRGKLNLSRDLDPLLADDTPGPGAYDVDQHRAMRGPSYTMRARIILDPNSDPLVVDSSGPGPGYYETTKY
ncbi:hypothetical protein AB1Y20_009563 [Prymnesium parvum]|uniref:Uncharacterized protein n=1 Tax=Prymnesium parvum TaxID=97485 RepID=A0AB34K6V4_PRYPA